jgi:hypothetical protein
MHMLRAGQNHIYTVCIHIYTHGIFGREITKYTTIYDEFLRFWPTLHMLRQWQLSGKRGPGRPATE